jgi:DNA (cytosine-5)-methyltransferase 1
MNAEIPVIDLFAGPGGLGEGFASLSDFFRIELSAECSAPAHRTLQLRAFKRILEREGLSLDSYYDYLSGNVPHPAAAHCEPAWELAKAEALRLTLGDLGDDETLARELERRQLQMHGDWVLIGGPPCQAYSMVGRARNRSKFDYVPEDDKRHFLYREYLKLIQHYRPAVFVMENVKGMLSSRVGGKRIFHQILRDLTQPDKALHLSSNGAEYRIHSVVDSDVVYRAGDDPSALTDDAFLVSAENYGVPQARHRIFLVGVREDIRVNPAELRHGNTPPMSSVLSDLPLLRSGLSRDDSPESWRGAIQNVASTLVAEATEAGLHDLAADIAGYSNAIDSMRLASKGGLRVSKKRNTRESTEVWRQSSELRQWLEDRNLAVWLNHEARAHMPSDLGRYLYAATFAQREGRSPVGAGEFGLPSLAPKHANWTTGKFADRFRVQLWDEPSKTITSHISKDGHYFIHPDPKQCRALTVREAARIQTFPDNYFFEGNRTEQYHQVGNAVPPWLARQIAVVVQDLLIRAGRGEVDRESRRYDQQIAMPPP